MKMPWGKHAGQQLEDIPSHYLQWLLSDTDVDKTNPALAAEAQAQLDMRDGLGVARGKARP